MPFKKKVAASSKTLLEESTPLGGGYAGFFSLQAGVIVTTTVMLALAIITFFYNLSAPNRSCKKMEYITQYVIVYFYVLLVIVGTGMLSTYTFKKEPKKMFIGTIIVLVAAAFWFALSVLSFITVIPLYRYVCLMDRCPPTQWVFEVPWREGSAQPDYSSKENSTNTSLYQTRENMDVRFEPFRTEDLQHIKGNHESKFDEVLGENRTLEGDTAERNRTAYSNYTMGDVNMANETEGDIKNYTYFVTTEWSIDGPPSSTEDAFLKHDVLAIKTDEPAINISSQVDEFYVKTTITVSHSEAILRSTLSETSTQTEESSAIRTGREITVPIHETGAINSLMLHDAPKTTGNEEYGSTARPPLRRKSGNSQWNVLNFMSSIVTGYAEDVRMGNIAMSVISFLAYSIFLAYGLWSMINLYRVTRKHKPRKGRPKPAAHDAVSGKRSKTESLPSHTVSSAHD